MPTRRRPPHPLPDLLDGAARNAAPRSSAPASRHLPVGYLLPSDLDTALRHLTDNEIKRLGDAVVTELDRRGFGMPMPPAPRFSTAPGTKSPKAPAKSRVPPPAKVPMTAAKANAIKAALMAGLKPNAIARQFGVSLAAIREALTEMKRT